jgi:hypothetical protein
MIQNREIRIVVWQLERNGKMYPMIGNARCAALPRLTLKKSSLLSVT